MYIFSVTATARQDNEDAKKGESRPFIIYINFADLFGAQALAQAYLLKAGFSSLRFDDLKHIDPSKLTDHAKVAGNQQLSDALRHGYSIQLFESH